MSPRTYTADQVELVRQKALDHSDPQIAELMGWPVRRVLHVRTQHQIPAMLKADFWTAERRQELRKLLVVEGMSGDAVGARLGCHGGTVRKAARKFGLVRNPAIAARERSEKARMAGIKGSAVLWADHQPKQRRVTAPKTPGSPAQKRYHFGNTAYTPKAQEARDPLDVRILQALAERPLSTATLATLIGDKEAYVSMQLSALAHAGRVLAGEGGPRERKWSLAA